MKTIDRFEYPIKLKRNEKKKKKTISMTHEWMLIKFDHKCFNKTTYTSSIRSPFLIPAFSAAPLSKTALTCCNGA